jgi:molecular chaperone Hsp33
LNEVQNFVFEDLNIRGSLVRLEETWQQVVAQHHYPEALQILLGEGTAATVLLATGLKGHPRISLQLQGDGPVKLLLIQCSSALEVRGMAQWRSEFADAPLLGAGRLAVNLDPGDGGQQFQGIVPLAGSKLNACLEAYFAQSEQLPTRLWLTASAANTAGLLLQVLPAKEPPDDAFAAVTALAATITPKELTALPAAALLQKLFPGYALRLFEPRPVTHDCRCTADYLANILRMLGAAELEDLLQDPGHVELTCEFCNRSFRYEDADVAAILKGATPAQALH